MKVFSLFGASALFLATLVSCGESTDSRKAGGAAFSDSELGRKLDANAPLESQRDSSFEQWRDGR